MTDDRIKQFKRFLKEKGVYNQFIKNYDSLCESVVRVIFFGDWEKDMPITLKAYFKGVDECFVIAGAFDWRTKPPYNFDFWREISIDWNDFLNNTYDTGRDKTI